MKKLFSLFVALVAALAVNATVVEFTPADFEGQGTESSGSAVSATKGGVTVACDKAFGHNLSLRCYKGSVLTISATETINTLVFQFYTTYNGGLDEQITVNATEWSNTMASQARIDGLKVYINEVPTPVTVDTIGVNEAIQRINEGKLGKCYVKGRVTKIDDTKIAQYKNLNCWMVDCVNPGDTLEGYKMNGLDNKPYASVDDVEYKVGDEVLFYAAALQKYNSTYEINVGYFVYNYTNPVAERVTLTATEVAVEHNTTEGFVGVELKGANFTFYGEPDMVNPKGLVGVYELVSEDELTYNGGEVGITNGSLEITYASETLAGVVTYNYALKLNATDGKEYVCNATLVTPGVHFPEDNNNIDVAMALELTKALPADGQSPITYNIYGYIAKDKDAWSADYKNQSFYMNDQASATTGEFLVYRGKTSVALAQHTYVAVTEATLYNYKGNTYETNSGAVVTAIDPSQTPVLRRGTVEALDTISVAEAIAIGSLLEPNAYSDKMYTVMGLVAKAYDPSTEEGKEGEQTWYMVDDLEHTEAENEIMVQFTVPNDGAVYTGDGMYATGKILHYVKTNATTGEVEKDYLTIRNADASHYSYVSAFENFLAPSYEKAQKVVENGQVLIIRNGQVYNLQGVQL